MSAAGHTDALASREKDGSGIKNQSIEKRYISRSVTDPSDFCSYDRRLYHVNCQCANCGSKIFSGKQLAVDNIMWRSRCLILFWCIHFLTQIFVLVLPYRWNMCLTWNFEIVCLRMRSGNGSIFPSSTGRLQIRVQSTREIRLRIWRREVHGCFSWLCLLRRVNFRCLSFC